jgi:molybdenum cofactor cytidylyltransferase
MGRAKALLPIGEDDTFLTRVVRTFQRADVEDIVVVLGPEAEMIANDVIARGLTPRFVLNADYETGQLSSLLAGLRAVDRPGVAGMLLTLVDVPLVSAETVRAVLDRFRAVRPAVARPVQRDRHGHPIAINRSLFDALRAADPSKGAKPIIRANVSLQGDVDTTDEGAFTDIDTPDEYDRFVTRDGTTRVGEREK